MTFQFLRTVLPISILFLMFNTIAAMANNPIPLFRLYNPDSSQYMLTADAAERNQLISNGWTLWGTSGYIYANNTDATGIVPLYRLYQQTSGDYFYTTDVAEQNTYVSNGYIFQGIAGYVFTANNTGEQALYCAFDSSTGQHLFTGGQIEYSGLSSEWTQKGIAAYLMASPAPSLPTLTQAQVINIATQFCQAIGASITSTPTAQFPLPREDNDPPASHWQSRWLVTFPSQATVEVVDPTGVVSGYTNEDYYARDVPEQLAGTLLTSDQAINRANSILIATAQTDQLSSATAQLNQDGDRRHSGDSSWQVSWVRQLNGILYQNDFVCVLMDAETSEITGMSVTFPTIPPANTAILISQNQAQINAQSQLASAGIANASISNIQTEIVQPTTFWQDQNTRPITSTGDVAWVVIFTESNNCGGEVWVDAQTGNVVGGREYGSRGSKPLKQLRKSMNGINHHVSARKQKLVKSLGSENRYLSKSYKKPNHRASKLIKHKHQRHGAAPHLRHDRHEPGERPPGGHV